ncbi:MAG: glycosyltransferase [Lachnospiraceae bacterium]|nr:glycosyltransferase [Lachnospiraceae bacterium]
MLVTVISAVCNSEKTIARTIESVLNQTYDNIEYIIVDGASTDRTLDIARSYQEAFGRLEGKTLTIVSEPDQGMYDALNKGARMAHGELVGQINSDDWYEPDAVRTMVELYEKERYAAAWGSVRMCGKNTWIKHAKIGKLWTTTGWCHPGMFSTRDTLMAFPYPIETMYGDFDFITAVRQAGKKIVTVDKVVSNFSFGRSGMSTRKSLKDVKSRVDTTYSIYKKYGMSKLYYWQRWAYEIIKYLVLRPFGQRR